MLEKAVEPDGADGRSTMHNGAIITPSFAFGISSAATNNLGYLEGNKLLYSTGALMAIYSQSNDEMRFIPTHPLVRVVKGLAVAPNKKYYACTEDVGEGQPQQVSIYSVHSEKLVKTLLIDPQITTATTIDAMGFSGNCKLLLMQCSEPDNALIIWRWFSNKVLATVYVEFPVLHIAFSFTDDLLLSAVGQDAACLYRMEPNGAGVRSLPFQPSEDLRGLITCTTWLPGNLLALGSAAGVVTVQLETDVKQVLAVDPDGRERLQALTARGRGFLAAGAMGTLYFFDPPDATAKRQGNHDLFCLLRAVPAHIPGRSIIDIAVSAGDQHICCRSDAGELLLLDVETLPEVASVGKDTKPPLTMPMTSEQQEHEPFHILGGGFHTSRIIGLDACSQQPLLAAVGSDNTVRIWNWQNRHSVVCKALLDDVLCCSLHPSGTILAVGMHDKLRLYTIALDELEAVGEVSVKKCSLVRFSPGGNVFAAVGRNNTIVLHSTYTRALVASLKGHVSVVTDLTFSADDRMLVSTGAGGAVYFWDLLEGKRLAQHEYVDKCSIYSSAIFHNSEPGAIVRTHDGRVQHLQDGAVQYEVQLQGGEHAPSVLLGDDKVVLLADNLGSIWSYAWPREFPIRPGLTLMLSVPHQYRLHAGGIGGVSCMTLLQSQGWLFTASNDGMIMMSSVGLVLGGALLEPALRHQLPNYLLVTEEKLAALRERMVEMANLVTTARSDAEYQAFRQAQLLRDAILKLEDELAEVRAKLEEAGGTIQDLRSTVTDKEKAVVRQLEGAHMAAAEELEMLYEKRLTLEEAKRKADASAADDIQFRLEEQLRRLKEAHAKEIKEVHTMYTRKLDVSAGKLATAQIAAKEADAYFKAFVDQTEDDFDDHADRMASRMGRAVDDASAREDALRNANGLLTRENYRLKSEKVIDQKRVDAMAGEVAIANEVAFELESMVEKLKVELSERDAVINDNWHTIQELRRRGQDLEKHKFVMSSKAETYQKELGPKDSVITGLKNEKEATQKELVLLMSRCTELQRLAAEKDALAKAMKQEVLGLKAHIRQQAGSLATFSFDLAKVMQASDDRSASGKSARQKALDEIYKKYCISEAANTVMPTDMAAAMEVARQRQLLELKGDLLQRRLDEDHKLGQEAQQNILKQNTQLLQEMQVYKMDLKELGRKHELTLTELRNINTKYRLLLARTGGSPETTNISCLGEANIAPAAGEWEIHSGGTSMAGRVHPSRPSTAISNHKRPASASTQSAAATSVVRMTAAASRGGWGSRPGTADSHGHGKRGTTAGVPRARPVSAGFAMYRTAGAATPSSLSGKINPRTPGLAPASQAVHDLIGEEQTRVSELMSRLAQHAQAESQQAAALSSVRNTLSSQAAISGVFEREMGGTEGISTPSVRSSSRPNFEDVNGKGAYARPPSERQRAWSASAAGRARTAGAERSKAGEAAKGGTLDAFQGLDTAIAEVDELGDDDDEGMDGEAEGLDGFDGDGRYQRARAGGRHSNGLSGSGTASGAHVPGQGQGMQHQEDGDEGEQAGSSGQIGGYALSTMGALAAALRRRGSIDPVEPPRPASAASMLSATSGSMGGSVGASTNGKLGSRSSPTRRPTSAAGFGMRASISSGIESWRKV